MTEKRFVMYEHKDNDYILDSPNTSLDFIEMLGDALSSEEIVDRLNKQYNRIKELEQEKESWKNFACHDMNLKSMLSFEISKLTETKDIEKFLDFYYKYFCKINGDDNDE